MAGFHVTRSTPGGRECLVVRASLFSPLTDSRNRHVPNINVIPIEHSYVGGHEDGNFANSPEKRGAPQATPSPSCMPFVSVAACEGIPSTANYQRSPAHNSQCDVSESGICCSNCRFYKKECVVSEKKKSQLMFMRLGSATQSQIKTPDLIRPQLPIGPRNVAVLPSSSESHFSVFPGQDDTVPFSESGQPSPLAQSTANVDPPSTDADQLLEIYQQIYPEVERISSDPQVEARDSDVERIERSNSPAYDVKDSPLHIDPVRDPIPQLSSQAQASTVLFSYYPYLTLKRMYLKSPEDISYLEANQCLRVPIPRILDMFVKTYFLHVHPHLPFLNEADFWRMFHQDSNEETGTPAEKDHETISLFVFQAMLFAACGFVSREAAIDLGFSSVRQAREGFWNRAKLLFDFEVETNSISIAQGSLLLAYHTASRTMLKSNSFWLEAAIRSAMSDDAHLYYNDNRGSEKQRNIRKRLWWCCVLRDRILPLGVRRGLFITFEHFAFDKFPMTVEDFEDEVDYSKVYGPTTKRGQIRIFIWQCHLAAALTDTIFTLYPMQNTPATCLATSESHPKSLAAIARCKAQLQSWYEGASGTLLPVEEYRKVDGSVAVGAAMICIYLYSAILGLCQYERLLLEDLSQLAPDQYNKQLHDCVWQFQNAVDGITKQVSELIRLELAIYLPVSIGAYTALPLALHLLDVRLAPQNAALKQRRLGVFIELFRIYEPRFLEIEFLWQTLRIVIDFLDIECPSNQQNFLSQKCNRRMEAITASSMAIASASTSSSVLQPPPTGISSAKDWREVFFSKPYQYLPMALLLDLAMAQNKVPNREDVFARLPTNSSFARLLPSPGYGPRMGNNISKQQMHKFQNLLEEDRRTGVDSDEGDTRVAGGNVQSQALGSDDPFLTASPPLDLSLIDSIPA